MRTLSSLPFCPCDGRQGGLWYLPARWRYTTRVRVVALGQRLRRFADHITATVGEDQGERVRSWFQDKLRREAVWRNVFIT